jgi:NADH:ubiquinone oxidoreductase subunit E
MKVQVCTWLWCKNKFSEYILTRLKNDKEFYKKDSLIIEEFKCMGDCKNWPNIIIDKEIHTHVTPVMASEKVFNTNKKKKK